MEAVQPVPAGPGLPWLGARLLPLRWRWVGAATLTGTQVQVILEGSQRCRGLRTGWGAVGTKPERARIPLSQTAWVQTSATSCKAMGGEPTCLGLTFLPCKVGEIRVFTPLVSLSFTADHVCKALFTIPGT